MATWMLVIVAIGVSLDLWLLGRNVIRVRKAYDVGLRPTLAALLHATLDLTIFFVVAGLLSLITIASVASIVSPVVGLLASYHLEAGRKEAAAAKLIAKSKPKESRRVRTKRWLKS